MSLGSYSFVAIKGQQGKHEYYLIQCPLRLVPRLFLFDEAEVPAALRRGRTVDVVRAADIAKYLREQPDTYVLAPIVATIDQAITFEPANDQNDTIGQINIPIAAQLILQDGQHRKLALQQLLSKDATSGNDTIPVMLFPDEHLARSQRLYTALNSARAKGSRSKQVLHEHSDLATLVQQLVDEVPLFQERTELEKTTISNRSTALFTLSAIYQANEALLGLHKADHIEFESVDIAQRFWIELGTIIPEWQQIIRHEVTASYLRQNYVHSHTVMLLAIGKAGHDLIKRHPSTWSEKLHALGEIDWSRSNTILWEGRAMVLGKMSKATNSVKLSTSAIKHILSLPLTQDEQELETLFSSKQAA